MGTIAGQGTADAVCAAFLHGFATAMWGPKSCVALAAALAAIAIR